MITDQLEKYLGENPTQAREREQLLADECGISITLVRSMRRGYTPSLPILKNVARMLKCEVHDLVPFMPKRARGRAAAS